MKKLIILNLLLTSAICGKLDVSKNVIEDVVHHSDEEKISLAYELAITRFPVEIVFNSLFDE